MKPWREVVVPHQDVLEGTFLQSEFAADITAVNTGKATHEYQDAIAFYARTFITEGMGILLIQVVQRLLGKGGEAVIQLQTGFGGGKTHTMLAVYHLATRKCPLHDLAGIPTLLNRAQLLDVPQARVAVLDGTAHAPGQPWQRGKQTIKTLWGELAWQLGGADGFALVAGSDAVGTSPGKDVLRELLERYAPCVILIDELVAYFRQFSEGQVLSGGSYDSNLSFIQALTEAVKLVSTAILLASLPESEVEAGSQRGVAALRALEKTFGRVQALWKPVATGEAFEIVRRRLFDPVGDVKSREITCRAFADTYITEGSKLPSVTQTAHYYDRLLQAYPIHPEVFDRLFEDWTTIDGFQRTRGVLKLMAKVIYRLWQDNNTDLMILPGSLPLYDGGSRNELTYYLPAGWDAVIERDIDGDRAETTEMENKEPRFGQMSAARRVARTLFLGSAPSSIATRTITRGIDRARVLLGCLQPEQASAVYSDALNRLVDRLHYLNASGDKTLDATRFWFDTRANLRREMEDRKGRFNDKTEARVKLADALKKVIGNATFFDGVHIFTPHADIPDDSALRLVILLPKNWYSRDESQIAFDAVLETIKNNGKHPRHYSNRLLFLAPDHNVVGRITDAARIALAWASIVEDVKESRLNIDLFQKNQAEKELKTAEDALLRTVRECYKWLLCPIQETPTASKPNIEAFSLTLTSGTIGSEIERVCRDNELVIFAWSPIHLYNTLNDLYWKNGQIEISAVQFFKDTLCYLYLPRFKNHDVLAQTLRDGANSRDFFGVAYGKNGDQFKDFQLGSSLPYPIQQGLKHDTLLLIELNAALAYEAANRPPPQPLPNHPFPVPADNTGTPNPVLPPEIELVPQRNPTASPNTSKHFHGTAEIKADIAKVHLVELADEIISVLCSDPNATVRLVVEISADFPNGVSDTVKRAVSENAKTLSLKIADWE